MNNIYKLSGRLWGKALAGIALSLAIVASITGCNDVELAYSGPE